MSRYLLVFTLLWPALAFAQEDPTSLVQQLSSAAVSMLAPLIVTVLLGLLAAAVKAIPMGFTWLQAHVVIKNHAAATAVLQRALAVVEPIVLSASQTTAAIAKADFSAGKIDKAGLAKTLADVKAGVIADARTQLTSHGLANDLRQIIGPQPLEEFLATHVEAILAKKTASVAGAAK